MSDLAAQRRFFAEEVQMAANIRSAALVEAFAAVPRERFLPPGPWTIRSETDFGQPPRQTPDADPRHVYHNIAVAIDASRMLFNGAPGLISMAIDRLALTPGCRVLHVGAGAGYFTALMAHCVGPAGRVVAIEVDEALASQARVNLASMPWVEVRHGDATGPLGETFDAILVNAGVTHPLESWLDALAPGARMILPVTATGGPMGPIGKGLMLVITRPGEKHGEAAHEGLRYEARAMTFVAIFSAVGIRDDAVNVQIGKALQKQPFPPIASLRRDAHDRTDECWLHAPTFCLSLGH